MRGCFLLIFFMLFFHLKGFGLTLKEKLLKAKPGTYVVTKQNKTYTLINIQSIDSNELIIEEISIPSHLVSFDNWKKWVQTGAKNCSSWILYAFDLKENKISECYSLNRKTHLSTEQPNAFFTPLISLELEELSSEERLKTTPTKRPGEVNSNTLWGPPMIWEGKKVKVPLYHVFKGQWPQDQGELGGKKVIVYFNHSKKNFPFPYWIQAKDKAIKFKIYATDSGENLLGKEKVLPRRPPQFIKGIEKKDKGFRFHLKAPLYCRNLKLYAIDVTQKGSYQTHFIPTQMQRTDENVVLETNHPILENILHHKHRYLWLVSDETFRLNCQTTHPFTFSLPPSEKNLDTQNHL